MVKSILIADDVIRFFTDANCYLVSEDILIDCSSEEYKDELKVELKKYSSLEKIRKVIFTHLHYDHIANFDLFTNAKFYASKNAVISMKDKKTKLNAILNPIIANKFNISLNDIADDTELTSFFEIYYTPGHTSTAICLLYRRKNILFTGDTFFRPGVFGRTDLPLSDDKSMVDSLKLVAEIIKKEKPIIAPGHDY